MVTPDLHDVPFTSALAAVGRKALLFAIMPVKLPVYCVPNLYFVVFLYKASFCGSSLLVNGWKDNPS